MKYCNFFAIEPILEILGAPKNSESVFFHNRTYFPGRFRESSSNRGSDFRDFGSFVFRFFEIQRLEIFDISKNIKIDMVIFCDQFLFVLSLVLTDSEVDWPDASIPC